jgi:hypothetical protein
VVELELRFSKARLAANDGGCGQDFDQFLELAERADAVVCMPPSRLLELLNPTALYSTFGLQLEGETRVPQDNRFDSIRASVEEAFFPSYSKHIRFAALSLRDVGHESYGACSVTIKKGAIASRASVFEFPLVTFADRTGHPLGQPIPPGHRAVWDSRGKLAAAKLGMSCGGMNYGEMADLILPPPTDTLSDCIEVHIYGSFNVHSIARVAIITPKDPIEQAIQRALVGKLEQLNINTRVIG